MASFSSGVLNGLRPTSSSPRQASAGITVPSVQLSLTQDSTTYAYDLGDRLTGITPASGASATFTLDALGRHRTRVLSAGGTDTYSYLGTSEQVVRIANSSGTTTDSIIDPAGNRLGVKAGGTVNWLVPDLHGSVAGSLNAAATGLTGALRYDGYGVTVDSDQPGSTGSGYFRYQGRLDISPGGSPLYDMSARFYAPGLGTFTQLDTYGGSVANPASLNRFLYAEANPATFIDPTGHMVPDCVGQDCGAIARANQRKARAKQQPSSTTQTTNPTGNTTPSASTGAPHVNSSTGTPQSATPGVTPAGVPDGTLRAQMKQQCLDSGPASFGYCSYYDWAPGLDGPAGDATPNLLVPLVLFGGPLAGSLLATCIATCSTAAIVSGLGLGGAAEPQVQQTIQNAASQAQTAASGPVQSLIQRAPLFSQTTASPVFKHGPFANRSIGEVAEALRAGTITAKDLPVDVIERAGEQIALNTRTVLALRRAATPIEEWVVRNVTGIREMEELLTQRLLRNWLAGGTDTLRITGAGANASNLR